MCVCTYIYMDMYIDIQKYVYGICMRIYIYTYVYMYICAYVHIYIYIYTHIYARVPPEPSPGRAAPPGPRGHLPLPQRRHGAYGLGGRTRARHGRDPKRWIATKGYVFLDLATLYRVLSMNIISYSRMWYSMGDCSCH